MNDERECHTFPSNSITFSPSFVSFAAVTEPADLSLVAATAPGLADKLALGAAASFFAVVGSWVETRGRPDAAEGAGEVTCSEAEGFAEVG